MKYLFIYTGKGIVFLLIRLLLTFRVIVNILFFILYFIGYTIWHFKIGSISGLIMISYSDNRCISKSDIDYYSTKPFLFHIKHWCSTKSHYDKTN